MTTSPQASDPVLEQVLAMVRAVFERKALAPPATLGADSPLDGSLGLDSLDFAEVVVRLERAFEFDPFSGGSVDQLATLGDLANLYRR